MTKFRHLPAAGRAIIIVVAIGVLAIAVVACATSYNAIYRLVGQLGLYGYRTNQAYPLLLDAAFLAAELAAILAGIMRAVTRSDEVSQGWPGATMLLCGLGTIGFNIAHAYLIGGRGDPLTVWRCVVAALVAQGIPVEETYAGRILGEWRVNHPAPSGAGKRGSGRR